MSKRTAKNQRACMFVPGCVPHGTNPDCPWHGGKQPTPGAAYRAAVRNLTDHYDDRDHLG